jgi:hypothetical protein
MTQPQPPAPSSADARPGRAMTDRLLVALTAAGPFYVIVATTQVATRDGFDIRRHAVSLLSNGQLGWIQIANFVIAGLLVVAGGIGLGRVLHDGPGATWIPRLLVGYGIGLVAAGVFVADPADGFPPGTPAGMPEEVSLSGVLHLAWGGLAFACLIAASIAVGRRAARTGEPGWSRFSWFTGLYFAAAFGAIASGGSVPLGNELFTLAVVLSWTWITLLGRRALAGRVVAGRRSDLALDVGERSGGVR